MNNITFRLVEEKDIPAIRSIYAPYVKETAISFELELPSIEAYRTRVKSISDNYPYIVALSDDKVVGYAYAHRHMERDAYQWNAELTVYIDQSFHHCGIGKKLYEILIEILKLQNVKNVYGGVTSVNEKSKKLHKALGFTELGTYHNAGYKCGAWHNVTWFEKTIGIYDLEPKPFVSIQNIDTAKINSIFDRILSTSR